MLNGNQLYSRLIESGIAKPESIIGCNPEELNQIQSLSPRPLPKSYLDFMARFGKAAGRFLRDIDIFYPKVLELKEDARYTLEVVCEGSNTILPENAFVFSMRQGEQLLFFELDQTVNDPPVMYYIEHAKTFTKVADCFWDVIESELELTEKYYRECKGTPYFFG